MTIAKLHPNEPERLKLLESYSIMDSLPERDYDNLTSLAAYICGTPISLITLVDQKRQWFKSHHGLDMKETSRDKAFCAHAINGHDELFMIEDARTDERFNNNPLVTENPNFVFYAGIPLRDETGLPLGTLCVLDHNPKVLNREQIEALNILSQQVMRLLELRKSKGKLKLANQALERFSDNLEEEVRDRTEDLEKSNAMLLKANLELESFAFISSHDLQEPLRKIQTFTSQILDEEKRLSESLRYKIDRIQLAAHRMRALLKDLLIYSKTKGLKHVFVRRSLYDLLEEVKDDLSEEIRLKEGKIELIADCTLDIIPFQFRQLLFNLIANSLKYATIEEPPIIKVKGEIISGKEISKSVLHSAERFCKITVIDNGIGFEQKYEDRIFMVFQRLNLQTEYSGTGIGLAIVKRIIQNHDGYITVSSSPGNGAKFEVFIPLRNL